MMRILFVTGTRADFGKLKPLIKSASQSKNTEVAIFITGMHMKPLFGSTWQEVDSLGLLTFKFDNHSEDDVMDQILAKTIQGLSAVLQEWSPSHVVVHGDRVEALAGAISSSFNSVTTVHVEGGELSGTIDESIRHAISKLSHIHLVSNLESKQRLLSMGENPDYVFVIGSPELDIMGGPNLPSLDEVKERYDIPFEEYAIATYHPVTTELEALSSKARSVKNALVKSALNWVIIEPNNDPGNEVIRLEFEALKRNSRFRFLPSMRFEHFVTLIKNSTLILGNSSTGVREAPFLGIPSINVGSRQSGRNKHSGSIINAIEEEVDLLAAIDKAQQMTLGSESTFGDGSSAKRFGDLIASRSLIVNDLQKVFFGTD